MQTRKSETEPCQDVTELKRQWHSFDDQTRPRCLWITCSDPGMDRAVERIVDSTPSLVLRLPGSSLPVYTPKETYKMSALDYAIDCLDVTTIVICGHSRCGSVRCSAPVPESGAQLNVASDAFSRMQHRMHERQSMLAQAKQHVVDQLLNLATFPSVTRGMQAGRVGVYGLFYMDESGIFLRYDGDSGEYVALVPSECA